MRIIEFIKKIICKKDSGFSSLKVGDIVWAKRYRTDKEKNKIKKGHRESPYVIIKKNKNKVYALQCTSNSHKEVKWKMIYYYLGKLNYKMKKDSYINCLLVYELKEVQFVEIIGRLSNNDLNQLKKHLYILKKSKLALKPRIENKYLDYKISVGDVILYENDRYYIYSIGYRNLYVYRLSKNLKVNNSILINNSYYNFIFQSPVKIKVKSKYDLVDTFNSGEIEIINSYREKFFKRDISKTLRVGSVIDYKNNMYYVYDEDFELVYLYQVYGNGFMRPGMAFVKVNGGVYSTFFATSKISKERLNKVGYKIRRCALGEEIDYNKMVFSLPKKERGRERKQVSLSFNLAKEDEIDNFLPMTILEDKNNKKNYLIIDRNDNVIEVVNINNMRDTFYFELDRSSCPFKYYKVLPKEEYDMYLSKVSELKGIAASFQ